MESILYRYSYGGTISNILILFFVLLWIYCILWVAKDISWRTDHFGLQLLSILSILFLTPFIGLPLYFLLRPVQTEAPAFDQDIYAICYACGGHNDITFDYCVFCGDSLKIACPHCTKPIGIDYAHCARCGKGVEEEQTPIA